MINVLVVDDSALMRRMLSDILNSDPEIKVIDTAINSKLAIEKIKKYNPSVVTMDINLPDLDGITTTKKIMATMPLPIVIVSAHSEKSSGQTIEAMSAGAIDFIQKPSGEISPDLNLLSNEIIQKIKTAANADAKIHKNSIKFQGHKFSSTRNKIIVIGSSTGGPQTLENLLSSFPKEIPIPIVIAQHMPLNFTVSLAKRLNSVCDLEVREAENGNILENGVVYLAPGGKDIVLEPYGNLVDTKIKIIHTETGAGARPNINKLFESAASIFKENTIGIVLTGMGDDGTIGSKKIKEFNGSVIAESKESSIIFSMPKSVIEQGLSDFVMDIDKMAVGIIQLIDV